MSSRATRGTLVSASGGPAIVDPMAADRGRSFNPAFPKLLRATLKIDSLVVNLGAIPQQVPCLAIGRILRLRRLGIDRDPRLPQNHFRGNDVPGVIPDNVSRQIVKRAGRIRLPSGAAHPAGITSLLQLEDGGLHLHRHKVPRPSHHTVITPRISPRPAHRQIMIGRPHHEMHLSPLAAKFLGTDLMFPLLHLPTSKRKRRHPEKTRECRLIYLFDSHSKTNASKF